MQGYLIVYTLILRILNEGKKRIIQTVQSSRVKFMNRNRARFE